eukprot:GHVR01050284.1.p1 GENE.GHVR01050284.1~~GHVR01050284.1.p1  ORF type:complete len:455 (+),score=112.16 GHVR01050284.1:278-1642(+)
MSTPGFTIPALCWIPRGALRSRPIDSVPSPEELEEANALRFADKMKSVGISGSSGDVDMDEKAIRQARANTDGVITKYNLDSYDDDDLDFDGGNLFSAINTDMNDITDPHLIDASDSEDEEGGLKATDQILVSSSAEVHCSELSVWGYYNGELDEHRHQELSAFPLSIQWIGTSDGLSSIVAVSSFESHIEVWDLDIRGTYTPLLQLGHTRDHKTTHKKKNNKSSNTSGINQHTDAVLSLHRSYTNQNALVSSGADMCVCVWDLNSRPVDRVIESVGKWTPHEKPIQCVRWNKDGHIACASYDKTISIIDTNTRQPVEERMNLAAEAECLCWTSTGTLLASTEDGGVSCWDLRRKDMCLWNLKAHEKPCTGIAISPHAPDILVSCGMDKYSRVWDMSKLDGNGLPSLLVEKNLDAGKLLCCESSIDDTTPYLFAFGGDKVVVWDINADGDVKKC